MTDTANHESYTQAAETVADSVKQAFTPVNEAFKNIQNLEVPEATREFFKRTATTGKEKVADIHDLHATILHLLGLNHEELTYRYAGRDFRLTDVYGEVIAPIVA